MFRWNTLALKELQYFWSSIDGKSCQLYNLKITDWEIHQFSRKSQTYFQKIEELYFNVLSQETSEDHLFPLVVSPFLIRYSHTSSLVFHFYSALSEVIFKIERFHIAHQLLGLFSHARYLTNIQNVISNFSTWILLSFVNQSVQDFIIQLDFL